MTEDYRIESKKNWHHSGDTSKDDIKTGSLQRIADATELMAKDYQKLISERDYYKRCYESEKNCSRRLNRSNTALRAWITRLKKKLAKSV